MEINIDSYDNTHIILDISHTNNHFLNCLRRIILSEIEIIAIDTVKVINNTTIIPDEIIAHRIGLCPLKYNKEICDNELNDILFHLDKTALEDNKIHTIYSSSLLSNNNNIYMFYDNIPLIKFNNGQKISLEITVKKDKGKINSKFQCVSQCYFKQNKDINNNLIEGSYKFYVKCIGNVTPKECLEKSLDILNNGLNNLSEKIHNNIPA